MSRIPGISPITDDIEDVRHSQDDGFFGEDRGLGTSETPEVEDEPEEEGDEASDDPDRLAIASVEGWRRPADTESWWRSA